MKELDAIIAEIEKVILGKDKQVKLAISCLLADGHLLLEDLPGMGKTTLSHAIAHVMGLSYQRIQFTSDLLPSDVVGSNIFEKNSGNFVFQKGPVFTQLLLADELNRATPKAQSALLESMEERQVSVDGATYDLPTPFFVIATQNPSSQSGTFELPESQLDRFLMRISLGYPDKQSELRLLKGQSGRQNLQAMNAVIDPTKLEKFKTLVAKIHCSDELIEYVYRLIDFTRLPDVSEVGLSTRAALGLIAASKAWALIHKRDYVMPEDVQAVFTAVASHRLVSHEHLTGEQLCAKVLAKVAVV